MKLRKLKVCIISNRFKKHVIGGAEICLQDLVDKLTERNIPVIIITITPYTSKFKIVKSSVNKRLKIYRINPINIYNLSRTTDVPFFLKPFFHLIDILNIHTFFCVRKILKKEKPTLVHFHNLINFSLSVILAAKTLNIPTLHTLHDYWLICPRGDLLHSNGSLCRKENRSKLCSLYSRTKFFVNKYIDVVISPSKFVLETHKKAGFFNSNKSFVIPHGIEVKNKKFKQKKITDVINVLFVGQLLKRKGIYVLLKAIENLKVPYSLKIAGTGPELNNLKNKIGNNPAIQVLGKINHEEIVSLYEEANVTVVPSVWKEPFGMVILESLSCSTPVIASNIGGMPEIVFNEFNGLLFKPGSSKELTSLLEKLFIDKNLYSKLQRNSFDSLKRFTLENQIKKIVDLYYRIAKKII